MQRRFATGQMSKARQNKNVFSFDLTVFRQQFSTGSQWSNCRRGSAWVVVKQQTFGIDGNVHQWFRSYLVGRCSPITHHLVCCAVCRRDQFWDRCCSFCTPSTSFNWLKDMAWHLHWRRPQQENSRSANHVVLFYCKLRQIRGSYHPPRSRHWW